MCAATRHRERSSSRPRVGRETPKRPRKRPVLLSSRADLFKLVLACFGRSRHSRLWVPGSTDNAEVVSSILTSPPAQEHFQETSEVAVSKEYPTSAKVSRGAPDLPVMEDPIPYNPRSGVPVSLS